MQLQQRVQPSSWARPGCAKRLRASSVVVCSGNGNGSGTTKQAKTSIHGLLQKEGAMLIPGCYDALSARILQHSGHKAAFVSGAAVSASLLGEADLGLLSRAELTGRTSEICAAVPGVPVLADADTGGGSVLSVQRTIRQLIAAGARGCIIEDQVWPKRTGSMRTKEVLSMEEFVGKLVAARDAIGDADFFLVARTDARGTSAKNGLEDAIRRANLYIDAGADASMVEAPRGFDELRMIGDQTKGLRVCNMLEGGFTPMASLEELRDMGFHIVLHPLTGLYAATRALLDSYGSLSANGTTTREAMEHMVSWREFNTLLGMDEAITKVNKYASGQGAAQRLTVKVRAPVKPVALGPYSEWPRRPE